MFKRTILKYFPTKKQQVLSAFKTLIFAYIAWLLLFLIFFVRCQKWTYSWFDVRFGEGFGISVASSMIEDLALFGTLGITATLISAIISVTVPEDNPYTTRIRSLLNSKNVKDDEKVTGFIIESLNKILTYNKILKYEIHLDDYFPNEKAYGLITKRTQVVSNMCRDKGFSNKQTPIEIETDLKINNSYGEIIHLLHLDPANENTTIGKPVIGDKKLPLKAGLNKTSIDIDIDSDSEASFRLCYSSYSTINPDNTSPDAWSYFQAMRYCSNVEFILKNELNNKKPVFFDLRRVNRDKSILPIADKICVHFGNEVSYRLATHLYPGEKVEFYIYDQI